MLFHYWFCKLYNNMQIICTHAHELDVCVLMHARLIHACVLPTIYFIIEVLIYALVWILGFQNILKAWVWCCCISSNSLEISSINVPKKLKHWGLHACVTLLIAYVWTVWQGWNSGKYPFFLYLCFCEVIKAYMWQVLDV